MKFKGKNAVVVGAAQNSIGRAVAIELAKAGINICIWDINTESAEKTAKEIQAAGGKAVVKKANALDYDSIKSVTGETIKEMSCIDYMVDTVGGGAFKFLPDCDYNFFKQQVEFNGYTMFNCAHNLLEHFTERNTGKMLFFISATGGTAGLAPYQAGKAVMKSLMETMVAELQGKLININCILPGIVPTELTLGAFRAMGMDEKAVHDTMGSQNPRGLNSPEEVAKVASFILADEFDRITGQVFTMM
jgi:3-oxoacyl-[acyl-carrier protein] reductase